ncbi:MAG: sulfotransferase [Caldilineaceae bacterium]|nr:sulfotransferase [Caldilineaceae bacterium]
MLPNFLGIGAARAGTNWIARNMAQHPDVFLPYKKELHFFDAHYEKGPAQYEAEFAEWSGQKAVGEITPKYLHDEHAASRIYELLPDAKLIVSLRNPVDRAYSSYWKSRASFPDETLATFAERRKVLPDLVEAGLYHKHLERYFALFPREQIHILLFEEIESAPERVLADLFTFLAVDAAFVPTTLHNKINAGAAQGAMGRSKVLELLARSFGRLGIAKMSARLEEANQRDVPEMDAATRAELTAIYRQPNAILQEMLGRDLSAWGV